MGRIVFPKKVESRAHPWDLLPVNAIWFGYRIFAGVIELRWGHAGRGWALTSDFRPYKTREIWDADARGDEGRVTVEAGAGVLQLQAEEHPGWPANSGSWGSKAALSPPGSAVLRVAPSLRPENRGRRDFWCLGQSVERRPVEGVLAMRHHHHPRATAADPARGSSCRVCGAVRRGSRPGDSGAAVSREARPSRCLSEPAGEHARGGPSCLGSEQAQRRALLG